MDEETARLFNRMRRELETLRALELPPARCAARYSTNAGQSIANNTHVIIDFEDKDYDTHTAVTTGAAWKFTCPTGQGGPYRVSVFLLFASTATWAAGEIAQASIYKGGVLHSVLDRKTAESATTLYKELGGSGGVYLSAGEFIDVRAYHTSGAALALHNDGLYNYISISRV